MSNVTMAACCPVIIRIWELRPGSAPQLEDCGFGQKNVEDVLISITGDTAFAFVSVSEIQPLQCSACSEESS